MGFLLLGSRIIWIELGIVHVYNGPMILATQNLGLRYGAQSLFAHASLLCHAEERYGITGKNGAGKSSALRVIAGQEKPTEGEVSLPQNGQVGMLKQDHFQYEHWRLLDVVIAGKADLWEAFKEKEIL